MVDKFIKYEDMFDGPGDSPESLEKNPGIIDPNIQHDLVILLQIKEIDNEIDNFLEYKENKLDDLFSKLHYAYNQYGERDDTEYRQTRSKNILKNAIRKDEEKLVTEKQKVDVLMYIKQKGLIMDSLKYGDGDDQNTCLSVVIGEVDEGDEEDDVYIFVFPEFVLNKAGHIQPGEEDMSLEIDIGDIKEIIVDETKYTFLF